MYEEDVTERPREIGDRPMMEESRPTGNGGELTKEYIPNKQQILRDYQINIRFLSVGCVINVGCKEIPFTNVSEAMEELNKYVSNPYEEGKRWNKIFDSAE
jgi:hypothetical protein